MDAFAILVVIFIVACASFVIYKIRYTKMHGIEAEAVVVRIEEETHYDSDGCSTSYDYFVRYWGADGGETEAKLANPGFKGFTVGERIKIKYLPEKPNVAVWVK